MSLGNSMKTCTKCGLPKKKSEFYKRKTNKDGLRYWCKECDKKYAARWNKKNPEKHTANVNKWKSDNRERHLEHGRNFYQRHKDEENTSRKTRARSKVKNAIERGEMTRQQCKVFDCFDIGEAHHEDYNKPLDVEWLCTKHHKQLHTEKKHE